MRTNVDRISITFPNSTNYKYPTLEETASYFGVQIDYSLHDASVDVNITRKIFIEMYQRGLIK